MIDGFQEKGGAQRFSCRFNGSFYEEPGQQLAQQCGGDGMAWQNLSQENRKSASAAAALSAIRTKNSLPTGHLPVGFGWIVAVEETVAVQRFILAAA